MERVKVTAGEELSDLMMHYKDVSYNPLHPFKVSYRGSYAADAGGLTRQLFTAIFNNFRFDDSFFEGEINRRLPKANPANSRSKALKTIGQMFVHSVVFTKGTNGPQFLSPAVVKYLMTEDMDIAATLIETSDMSIREKHYFLKVCV